MNRKGSRMLTPRLSLDDALGCLAGPTTHSGGQDTQFRRVGQDEDSALTAVVSRAFQVAPADVSAARRHGNEARSAAIDEARGRRSVETTQAELDGFAAVQRLLGPSRPVEYEDMPGYFKIHLAGKPFWAVCCLLHFGERRQIIRVRLPAETVQSLTPTSNVTPSGKCWCRVRLANTSELELLQPALCKAWDELAASYATEPDTEAGDEQVSSFSRSLSPEGAR